MNIKQLKTASNVAKRTKCNNGTRCKTLDVYQPHMTNVIFVTVRYDSGQETRYAIGSDGNVMDRQVIIP